MKRVETFNASVSQAAADRSAAVDRLAVKLLAHAVRRLGDAIGESLCASPDRSLARRLVAEAREMLNEFDDVYAESAPLDAASDVSGRSEPGRRFDAVASVRVVQGGEE